MAAGDLIVADYQFELGGLLFGAGTSIRVRRGSPTGFGLPGVKTQDVSLAHAHGSVGGRDYLEPRVITWALFVREESPEASMGLATQVLEAFNPSLSDVELHGQLPGLGRFYLDGRPRGCDMDLSRIAQRQVELFATFVALDPTVTTIEES